MTPEEIYKIKCNHLIKCVENLLSSSDYTHPDNKEKTAVVVSRKGLDNLLEAVGEVVK